MGIKTTVWIFQVTNWQNFTQNLNMTMKRDAGKWDTWNSLGFSDTNRSPNQNQKIRPSDNCQKKRTCHIVDFTIPQSENQRKWKERQVLRSFERTKKIVEHEGDGNTNCKWNTWNGPQRLGKGTGRVNNWRKNQDHSIYSIVKISSNMETWRLAVIQTSVKNLQGV